MRNILITGANGFIGKNLINKLNVDSINILTFTKENNLEELKKLLLMSDFIYHFAGEVKPNSSNEEFKEANVTLTKIMIKILEENNRKIPILLASSIHAKLLKNEYGRTKRDSEILIEEYSKNNNIQCYIYQLPHVFGEGCKANYNSVISTWISNRINNLEINVFNRDIQMNYVYVQDIIESFIRHLENKNNLYVDVNKVYETTLGEVVDYLKEFNENINNNSFEIKDNEFKQKLFITYKDYYKKLTGNR